jgi:transposase
LCEPRPDRVARRTDQQLERELRALGAGQPYVPLLMTAPGIAWILAYTIAAELGDISRFPTPRKQASEQVRFDRLRHRDRLGGLLPEYELAA